VPNLISIFRCLRRFAKESVLVRGSTVCIVADYEFYGGGLLAPRPTPKLEDHPLSAVRDCLFSIFASTRSAQSRCLHTGHDTYFETATAAILSSIRRVLLQLGKIFVQIPHNVTEVESREIK
jgi:hypothetical protein